MLGSSILSARCLYFSFLQRANSSIGFRHLAFLPMALPQTILFYLLFGLAVAAAVALDRPRGGGPTVVFRVITAVFFWPLYLPVLLDRPARRQTRAAGEQMRNDPRDEYAAAIAQVEAELEAALDSLDGWAENVLAPEQNRFSELRAAWRSQADRIRQLDRLLGSTDLKRTTAAGAGLSSSARYQQSEQARQENFERLRVLRGKLHDDLLGTLAWVRELVSMIHLAKFTGAPASRAEELVAQIATAVEGLSEVALPI